MTPRKLAIVNGSTPSMTRVDRPHWPTWVFVDQVPTIIDGRQSAGLGSRMPNYQGGIGGPAGVAG